MDTQNDGHRKGGALATREHREAARKLRLAICHALARFGWLKTEQVAKLVLPDEDDKKRRDEVVRKHLYAINHGDGALVAKRILKSGKIAYVLTARGAMEVFYEYDYQVAPGDWLLRKKVAEAHRFYSNEYMIEATHSYPEAQFWTEYQITSGKGPWGDAKGVPGKNPDGLLLAPDGYVWVETERAHKGSIKVLALGSFVREYLTPKGRKVTADGKPIIMFILVYGEVNRLRAFLSALRKEIALHPKADWEAILPRVQTCRLRLHRTTRDPMGVNKLMGVQDLKLSDGKTFAEVVAAARSGAPALSSKQAAQRPQSKNRVLPEGWHTARTRDGVSVFWTDEVERGRLKSAYKEDPEGWAFQLLNYPGQYAWTGYTPGMTPFPKEPEPPAPDDETVRSLFH